MFLTDGNIPEGGALTHWEDRSDRASRHGKSRVVRKPSGESWLQKKLRGSLQKRPQKNSLENGLLIGTIAKRRAIQRLPSGYRVAPGGRILVPGGTVVEPNQLRKGITKAKDEINDLIQEVIDTSTTDYDIHEIEFAASFSADGKFMGIGVGGAATIKFRIRPC